MNIEIVKPYGYCVGVQRVINILKKLREDYPTNSIYCMGEVVHNELVNNYIKSMNIEILTENPLKYIGRIEDSIIVFPAHGTSDFILKEFENKNKIINVVCPFVQKEFEIIKSVINKGETVIYIGKKNHAESVAALSISNSIIFIEKKEDVLKIDFDNNQVYNVINQTTLSILDLKDIYEALSRRVSQLKYVDEICNATRVRQESILNFNTDIDGLIVVGDKKSNNSNSLLRIAESRKIDSIMVDSFNKDVFEWAKSKRNIKIISGTSTPNKIVEDIFNKLKK